MKNTFENEVVYITGASAGIGYTTAQLCLQYGATVVITGRNKDNLDKAQKELLKVSSKPKGVILLQTLRKFSLQVAKVLA